MSLKRAGKYGENEEDVEMISESFTPPRPSSTKKSGDVLMSTAAKPKKDEVREEASSLKVTTIPWGVNEKGIAKDPRNRDETTGSSSDELKPKANKDEPEKQKSLKGLGRERNQSHMPQTPPTLAYAENVQPPDEASGKASMPRDDLVDEKLAKARATMGSTPLAYSHTARTPAVASMPPPRPGDDLVNEKLAKTRAIVGSSAPIIDKGATKAQGRRRKGGVAAYNASPMHPGAVAVPGDVEDQYTSAGWVSTGPSQRTGVASNPMDTYTIGTDDSDRGTRRSRPIISATRVEEPVMVHATAVPKYSDMMKRHKYKLIAALVLVLAGVGVALGITLSGDSSSDDDEMTFPPILATVKERGVLRCGVSNKLGFSLVKEETGEREGWEIDLCRAVAAAVLGESYKLETVVTISAERFRIVNSGTVDLVVHSATHTMERDVFEVTTKSGFSFSVPYLYDGLGFGGVPPFASCANNVNILGECADLKVCVEGGTTHIDVLRRVLPSRNTVVKDTDDLVFQGLIDGDCNVIAGEQFNIAEITVRNQGYTGPYESGNNLFSKEPLTIVTRDGDPEWADFVNWVLRALFTADDRGISQSNAVEIGTTNAFGDMFENMFVDAIATVGNYGDIYDRHLEDIVPRQGLNLIYDDGGNGLLYAHPFGTVFKSPAGPGPVRGGKLETIADRGFLRCGVTNRTGFAQLDADAGKWSGLDVDYCLALSASIFGGTVDTVEFVGVFETDARYMSLANGDVDVLAGGIESLGRDSVNATLEVGFSFTQPYFYASSDIGGELAAGETFALVTSQTDTQWEDFVYWIVASTFYAEEINVTQTLSNEMPEVNLFGPQYSRMFRDAILATGNYGEMYARNLEPFIPRSSPNTLTVLNQGPQHYIFPMDA